MPIYTPLDYLPIWGIFVGAVVGILLAHELGYELGRRRGRQANKEADPPVGGMVAAELGLLAFLLAFTFSMAAMRFDERRQLLLDEANAVGTTYLRAEMLPDAHRSGVRRLLRDYVDLRLSAAQGAPVDEVLTRSEELHRQLWDEAVSVTAKDTHSIPTGLFVQSLNDVIDLHAKRTTATLRIRIPLPVWVLLFSVAILSFMVMGYHIGLTRMSRSPAVLVIIITFAAVLFLIADLDRSSQGLLRVSQAPLMDLRKSMDLPGG